MKPLQIMTQKLHHWKQERLRDVPLFGQTVEKWVEQILRHSQLARTHWRPNQIIPFLLRPSAAQSSFLRRRRSQPPLVLAIAILSLTSAIGYRFYDEPQLAVGTIAPQSLRAPVTVRIIDQYTTEANRKAARTAGVPVMMIDQSINQKIDQTLQTLLREGDDLRQQAGQLPFVDPSLLSTTAQRYLRQAPEWQWQATIATLEGKAEGKNIAQPDSSLPNSPRSRALTDLASSSQELAILELQNYRRASSADDFSALKGVIALARQRYATALLSLSGSTDEEKFYDPALFNLTDPEWDQTKAMVRQTLERMLTQGITPGIPPALLDQAIKVQLEANVPANVQPQATKILAAIVKPNLTQDIEQTKLQAEQAALSVKDVIVTARRGDTIVRQGEQISQEDFVLLDHFGMSRRRINWLGLMGFSGLVSGAVAVFLLIERKFHPGLRRRDRLLILLLTLTAPVISALGLPATSLPVIGLLVGSFYGSALGITVIGLLTIILPIGMEIAPTNLIAGALGSLVGAIMAEKLRSREELALLGGVVGLTQGGVYLVLTLISSAATSAVWYVILTSAAIQSLIGIAWSVVALGISPYLEQLFDLVTPIRLSELSNPNRPLLERLASITPGTFQHTLFVATLAEAAARALGCSVELVRAGTLYHDIGKMHDPLGFIENQMGGVNKHDEIDNPWVSAALIKKHVTEGIVMARRCRLPKAIQAFIPEHQGTMLISYFYYQALQEAKDNPELIVNEADFRYDGPIPQSRETGIVMLADSCEAALRSLKEASREEALAMVNRILRARWQDNQLVESGLNREEMTCIAEIFVQVWLQFNHQRLPYPKAALSPQVRAS
ncbi:MAG: HDIG domain-containing protein [Leptolyngbyaceae cyanobacterium CSU_1_4]|nr:HDIG domain-containing protein [Leptolyngbyaceae cyanobacterium CSU_1_4]